MRDCILCEILVDAEETFDHREYNKPTQSNGNILANEVTAWVV